MKARKFVTDALKEHLPTWRVIDNHARPDALDRLTVFVATTDIARASEAPMGSYDTTVSLILASPKADNIAAAEADLEEALEALVQVIENELRLVWGPAAKTTLQETYLAWTVPIHVYTSRKD
ncbi:hypothetical protein LG314_07935 [Agrococcus terreus]|uniref:hypothetical protein n=1 Tax=Agrococcus terreus TaxID=574649 RepID=UPI00384CE70C